MHAFRRGMRTVLCAVTVAAATVRAGAHQARAQTSPTRILESVRVDTRKPIDFHAAAFPETLYVGQQATYQVAVFLSNDARSRLRRNPEFLPPELRGLLAYELGRPTRVPPSVIEGAVYEAHVFQRALFPVAPGPLAVPAPQLTYALPQSSSYFSREERFVVRAESAQLVVRAIPTEGRPANFTGAVGVLTATTRLDSAAARVGDPLVFTLRVQGVGNVKLLPRPQLEIDWASAVPATERVRVDTAGPLVRGSKEFDWILTPSRAGRVTIPVVHYAYFDPYLQTFADATSGTFEVDVRPGVLMASEEGESTTLLSLRRPGQSAGVLRTIAAVDTPVRIASLAVLVLSPLPALFFAIGGVRARRRAARASRVVGSMERMEQLRTGVAGVASDLRAVRRTLHSAIADRLQLPAGGLVSQRQLMRALRRRGVTRATTDRVVRFLDELDAIAFSSEAAESTTSGMAGDGQRAHWMSPSHWAQTGATLYAAVDAEAVRGGGTLPPDRMAMHIGGVLLALSVVALAPKLMAQRSGESTVNRREIGVTLARPAAPVVADAAPTVGKASTLSERLETDRRAVEAYERRMFMKATELFGRVAQSALRDADAQANWGTAAWAAGDTVSAVIGWQRAARLNPLDASLQERLTMLPSGARGGLADVPMVPVPVLLIVALLGWAIGWWLLALHWRRQHPGSAGGTVTLPHSSAGTGGALLLLVGIAAGGSAWWGRRMLDPHGLAVVSRPETMHVAPGSDSDAMGGVSTGDVVRYVELREGWRRVQHADGRIGWLPAGRTVPLRDNASGR